MKKYIVSWNETTTCYANVEAKSKAEAKEIALKMSYKNNKLDIDLINADNVEVTEE